MTKFEKFYLYAIVTIMVLSTVSWIVFVVTLSKAIQ